MSYVATREQSQGRVGIDQYRVWNKRWFIHRRMGNILSFQDTEDGCGVCVVVVSSNTVSRVHEVLEPPRHNDGRWDNEMTRDDALVAAGEYDGCEEEKDHCLFLVQGRVGLSDEESSEHIQPLPLRDERESDEGESNQGPAPGVKGHGPKEETKGWKFPYLTLNCKVTAKILNIFIRVDNNLR